MKIKYFCDYLFERTSGISNDDTNSHLNALNVDDTQFTGFSIRFEIANLYPMQWWMQNDIAYQAMFLFHIKILWYCRLYVCLVFTLCFLHKEMLRMKYDEHVPL